MSKIRVPQVILNLNAKRANLTKKWDTYVAVNKKYISQMYLIANSRDNQDWKFPLNLAKEDCGKIRIGGKQEWVWHLFYDLYPFFKVQQKGDKITGKISEIIYVNFDRKTEILSATTILEKYFPGLTNAQIRKLSTVPVDLQSLDTFIRTTNQEDIKQAKAIKDIVEECQSEGITKAPLLPHQINSSPFGRAYHRGINLQTCKKQIRKVALGPCWEYDLNAAVVTVKLMCMEKLYATTGDDIDKHFTASKDYLKRKSVIRQQLADVLYNGRLARHKSDPQNNCKPDKQEALADIKEAFTAISFGADASGSIWLGKKGHGVKQKAFPSIIPHEDDRNDVLDANNNFLRRFVKEQKKMTKQIVDDFLSVRRNKTFVTKNPDMFGGARTNKRKVMACIYQHKETEIINQIEAGIVAGLKENPILLKVHDGFYSSKQIPKKMLKPILNQIQYNNCKTFKGFLDLSEEKIVP